MGPFEWDAKYSVDIGEIDREHQQLFAIFGELYQAMQDGHGQEVIGPVLARVSDYTRYHFAHEERLFDEHRYADHAAHRAEHAKLAELTGSLVHRQQDGRRDVTIATLKFLSGWLNEHILGCDRKFAAFLIEKGLR